MGSERQVGEEGGGGSYKLMGSREGESLAHAGAGVNVVM